VADHIVDRGADRAWEALVVQWGRDRALHIDDVLMADAIQ
jgi:hypothetical protein